jgi:hypothetical protein
MELSYAPMHESLHKSRLQHQIAIAQKATTRLRHGEINMRTALDTLALLVDL